MYLKGSKWSMNKRRRPFNYFKIFFLLSLIGFGVYFSLYISPSVQQSFLPTPTPTKPPETYIAEAEQAFNEGKLLQAIELYKEANAMNPSDPSIYTALARTQVWAGKYPEAQADAENALLLNPDNSTAHAVRGWALSAQKDYLAAETSLKRALELDPNNALAHAYYSEFLTDQYLEGLGGLDIIDKMSEESRIALSLAPGLFEAHRARGYVFEATGNNAEAINEYESAATIQKNLSDIYLSLGRVYRASQVNDKAVNALTVANQLNPSDPNPLLIISRIYANIGENAKAEQYAQQAMKISPMDPNLRGNLGVMLYKNFKWELAAAELALVVNGGTDAEGNVVEKLELVADSLRIPEYYFTFGLTLVKIDRCGEAIPIFYKIIDTVAPTDEISLYNANEGIRLCTEKVNATPSEPAVEGDLTPAIETETALPATLTPTPAQ
jgi:tetratricopeptide (TPR) repeat protein